MRFCTADFGEQAGSPFFFFLFSVVCLLRDLHPAVKGSVLGAGGDAAGNQAEVGDQRFSLVLDARHLRGHMGHSTEVSIPR